MTTTYTVGPPHIKELLRMMFHGWVLREASMEQRTEHTLEATRSEEDAMAEACGGDKLMGELLVLFGHWSNDIVSIAAHYGLGLARRQPDGTLLHDDSTVDTLMKGGKLEIIEVPPAPSREHYWHAGKWNLMDLEEVKS